MPLVEHLLPDVIVAYCQFSACRSRLNFCYFFRKKHYEQSDRSKSFFLLKDFLPQIIIQNVPIRDKRLFFILSVVVRSLLLRLYSNGIGYRFQKAHE